MSDFPPLPLASRIDINSREVSIDSLPDGVVVKPTIGIAGSVALDGHVLFRSDSLYETRATKTPGGDYLLMFPANTLERPTGRCHYGRPQEKVNDLVAIRSSDGGATWAAPTRPIDIDYNLHGLIPLIPAGSKRIYNFGTQPIWSLQEQGPGLHENAPIGYRYSDDDGHRWSEVMLIKPSNDARFQGMSVMRMCETDRGTWLLGSHEGDWVLPAADDPPVPVEISRRGGQLAGAARPAPWRLVKLSDGTTLVALHHNRFHDLDYNGLITTKEEVTRDRGEVWVAASTDGGLHWSPSCFLFTTAAAANRESPFDNYQCSYIDAFADAGRLHLFLAHRWEQVLHLWIEETALSDLPTAADI